MMIEIYCVESKQQTFEINQMNCWIKRNRIAIVFDLRGQ